jgi:DNA-binding MarR family transcriptional regulator
MFEQHRRILHEHDRRMKLVRLTGKRAELLARGRAIGRLGKSPGAQRQGLIGAENETSSVCAGYH